MAGARTVNALGQDYEKEVTGDGDQGALEKVVRVHTRTRFISGVKPKGRPGGPSGHQLQKNAECEGSTPLSIVVPVEPEALVPDMNTHTLAKSRWSQF